MRQRAWEDLLRSKPFTDHDVMIWPSITELTRRFSISSEYRAVRDIGLPRGLTFKTETPSEEKLLDWLSRRIAAEIHRKWMDIRIHECLSLDDFIEQFSKTSENVIKDLEPITKSDYNYPLMQNSIEEYYNLLENRVLSCLIGDKKPYNLDELDLIVPNVQSEYYDREKIIKSYTEYLNNLKSPNTRARIEAEMKEFEKM